MNSGEDLDVFKLAHELALKIYSVTKKFPSTEHQPQVPQDHTEVQGPCKKRGRHLG
jgi:hypothetical protein